MSRVLHSLSQQEQLNFLLTNRVPRRWLTQFMGWFSKIDNPALAKLSIATWRLFASDLDLSEASEQQFNSLHDCFIRQLKPGSRTIDQRDEMVCSPCDAIIGSCGAVQNGQVFQAKGFPYDIADLIPDPHLQRKYEGGSYVTLRLKSSMYHRFHAPLDCRIDKVTYISGDTWNVNPIALKRIENLYCKNERAVMQLHPQPSVERLDCSITLVPVAAILVASMKLHCLEQTLNMKYRGPNEIACRASYQKGDELGYFQHGSTIIVFATANFSLCENTIEGQRIAMGQPLLRDNTKPATAHTESTQTLNATHHQAR